MATTETSPSAAGRQAAVPSPPGGWRTARLYMRLAADADVAALPAAPPSPAVVRAEDLARLPEAAQRYLTCAGVTGHTADWSLAMHSRGRFRMRRGWPQMPCEAWQYNSALAVARVFWMRIDAAGFVPMTGRDSYLSGRGRMRGTLAGLLTVAEGSGQDFDVSELVTFLNDAVLFTPSMLLRLPVTWAAVDGQSFDVTLADHGRQVTGRVYLDDRGLPRDFSTDERYRDAGDGSVRTRWRTPVARWRQAGWRWQPAAASAVWELADGPLAYAEFTWRPEDVRYNIAPPSARARGE
ncbi:MAG TPA: DUF6544 family protein [Streptosporangiaceae bacterium]|nr:DUF6544 family protein [Streptosporangiaceae bacterium]